MIEFNLKNEHFSAKDILECGQIFRYIKQNEDYFVFSKGEACLISQKDGYINLKCTNEGYFKNFFDLDRDYSEIVNFAHSFNSSIINESVEFGKGIRILNQDKLEMIFSFIISQNNHIPRIKKIIDKICSDLGEKKEFLGYEYFSFPTLEKLAEAGEDFYKQIGAGYRASYLDSTAKSLMEGYSFENLDDVSLRKKLMQLKGIGSKVADCVMLFGFHRTKSFPVDTWIEKVYLEDLKGQEKNRDKIACELVAKFGDYSGYIQQYLFYHKRENK